MSEYAPLAGVLNEAEVLKILGVRRSQLDALRYAGLPFVKLSSTTRVYLEDALMDFFRGRVVRLNRAGGQTHSDEDDTQSDAQARTAGVF